MRTWLREWLLSRGGPDVYFGANAIPGVDTAEIVAVVVADLAAGVQRERLLFALVMLFEWHRASSRRVAELAARYNALRA
jgi:hypothetical protein